MPVEKKTQENNFLQLNTDEKGFELLMIKIRNDRGFHGEGYKIKYIKRRVAVRMRTRKIVTYRQYINLLNDDPEEYGHLMNALTINVTSFFRNPETFNYISGTVLPVIAKRKMTHRISTLRIWSGGCASGEETWSLAILADQNIKSRYPGISISILGTDIDKEAIAKAQLGRYNDESMKDVSPDLKHKYFSHENSSWVIKPFLRSNVRFMQTDLMNQKVNGPFDIIFCRNVMIYFTRDIQDSLNAYFHRILNYNGFLVLGKTETILGKTAQLFTRYNVSERIYVKASKSGD